jgi:hypothetical protein
MTDEDDKFRTRVLKILLFVSLFVLFSGILYLGVDFITDGQGGYLVSCNEYDGEMSTGEELKEEWIISDNITSYEDIPQSQKDNISNNTVEVLKGADGLFSAINYTEMSADEKELFRKALNTSVRANSRPYARVVYRGNVYSCDMAVLEG